MKKKILALALALCMVLALAACGVSSTTDTGSSAPAASSGSEGSGSSAASGGSGSSGSTSSTPASTDAAPAAPAVASEITLWTYPIGNWGNEETVKALTDAFTAETGISVKVEYLTYADGDDKVNTALTANQAPDLIMEGPERLVSNWGANGYMVNIGDLFDETAIAEINTAAWLACLAYSDEELVAYEYPLCMTAHCMGINVKAFEEAGALQYVDLENHTWTTEQFINAVNALYDYYGDTVGAVFCGGQGGDQGTRALVNNLYGGTFTDEAHKVYTWDDPKNIKALQELYNLKGIDFDPAIVGGDEIANFYNGIFKMAFCWNIAQQLNPNSAGTGAEKTLNGDDIAFMAFPTESGDPKLQGGIWGLGIFNSGDEARIEASRQFIKFMAASEHTYDAVRASNFFAVRDSVNGKPLEVWSDNEIMNQYNTLMQYLGDYYQVTPGWAQARTAWWNMLQQVGASDGSEAAITAAVNEFCGQANAAAG